jgi:hypothetical protein
LPGGKVLAVGGTGDGSGFRAELYSPAAGMWRSVDPPPLNGESISKIASAILLSDGDALAVAGRTAALYDPATEEWSRIDGPGLLFPVLTLTLLRDGRVLAIGGEGSLGRGGMLAELYDPGTGEWNRTRSPKSTRAAGQYTATLLPNGRVLLAGGYSSWFETGREELYNPATDAWSYTSRLIGARRFPTATLLEDGKVLVTGGVDEGADQPTLPWAAAELYDAPVIVIPRISNATVSGKKLLVTGENFDSGAVILLNGQRQKTKNDDRNPEIGLIGKKTGKRIKPGDRLQVRNADGTTSEEFTFTGS